MPWLLYTPKRYKRNAINADVHHSTTPDYPQKFVESVIRNGKVESVEDDYTIPPGLFDIA